MGRRYRKGIDWKGVIFVVAMFLIAVALSGCVSSGPIADKGKAPLPNFCEVQVAYRPPVGDLQHVAKAPYTTDYLLKINQFGARICGWKPQ